MGQAELAIWAGRVRLGGMGWDGLGQDGNGMGQDGMRQDGMGWAEIPVVVAMVAAILNVIKCNVLCSKCIVPILVFLRQLSLDNAYLYTLSYKVQTRT